MDIGDIIFFIIFVLVIFGKVLSWVFKVFVEKAPIKDDTKKQQASIWDQVGEWFRALETNLQQSTQSTDSKPAHWRDLEPEPVYTELQPTPQFDFSEDVQKGSHKKQSQRETIVDQKKSEKQLDSRKFNLRDAIIHYEIISPPLGLRQEL